LDLISDYKTHPFDDDLLKAFLNFLAKIMDGGNTKV